MRAGGNPIAACAEREFLLTALAVASKTRTLPTITKDAGGPVTEAGIWRGPLRPRTCSGEKPAVERVTPGRRHSTRRVGGAPAR